MASETTNLSLVRRQMGELQTVAQRVFGPEPRIGRIGDRLGDNDGWRAAKVLFVTAIVGDTPRPYCRFIHYFYRGGSATLRRVENSAPQITFRALFELNYCRMAQRWRSRSVL